MAGVIRDLKWSSRSSLTTGLQKNADGSVDLYFGPKAPTDRESNWVPTNPQGKFEVLFRFYGPERALFEKIWKLPDIEEMKKSTGRFTWQRLEPQPAARSLIKAAQIGSESVASCSTERTGLERFLPRGLVAQW